MLPFLFWLNAPLAWVVLLCAGLISIIILAYLKPMREMYSRVVGAETWKAAALSETIIGIKTVKALALEPQRRAQWDERVAETGKWRLAFARLSNWPQTLVTPIERFMTMGTLMLGAYWAMDDSTGYMVGELFAFMMLSGRVAQPLVGMARLELSGSTIELTAAVEFKRRGTETKLVLLGSAQQNHASRCDPALIKAIARGRAWFEELATGRAQSLQDLARRDGITRRYIRRLVDLAFLSPQLVEAILQGRQPVVLTATRLTELDLPLDWAEQKRLLAS